MELHHQSTACTQLIRLMVHPHRLTSSTTATIRLDMAVLGLTNNSSTGSSLMATWATNEILFSTLLCKCSSAD